LLFSWTINLGFLTKGKLAAIFIKTFSWGFPTGRSFYFINKQANKFSGTIITAPSGITF
jgi:hypothetical protein